jgi:hypothetical protein
MGSVNTKHPARSARQVVGAASVAAFVGAIIGVATHGQNGSTQPAGAATTPATTPATSQQQSPFDQQGDGQWGATQPNDGFQSGGGNDSFGGGNSFASPPSHSQSGAS